MSIHIPAQRSAPDQDAAVAAPAPVAEPGWGGVLRIATARATLAMVLSLVVWSILPLLVGWTPQVILSGSMEPRIHSGDVIVTREVQTADLTKGQVITTIDPDSPEKTRTHRMLERDSAGKIVTKGDANRDADSTSVTDAAVLGLGVVRVPYVGRPAYWLAEHNYGALAVTFLLLGWCVLSAFPGRVKPQGEDTDEDDTAGPRPTPRTRRVRPVRSSRTNRRRRVLAAVTVSVIAVGAVGGPADAAFKQLAKNPVSTLNAASTFYPYKSEVNGDSPYLYWRLDETSGTAIADSSGGTSRPGTLLAQTYSLAQTGALAETPNRAIDFTVASITSNTSHTGPATFSVEAWVKTGSSNGGRILGFGDGSGANASSTVDRQLYLGPNGRVYFGIGSAKTTIMSTKVVNNNAWHHVVGTYVAGTNGMKLYVDGVLQGQNRATPVLTNGYWRAGAEGMSGWNGNPGQFYDGLLDELAVYTDVLTPTEVAAHYEVGTEG
ncbi:MAG: signal peptidase I [Marmoricola sp.]